VRYLSDRVTVMYGGRVVEEAPTRALYEAPAHPYTRGLLAAVPGAQRDRAARIPAGAVREPAGECPFYSRCPEAETACAEWGFRADSRSRGHTVACRRAR
jgi:oligopeptide/dipeptide ABC transporter ATP-binding protein